MISYYVKGADVALSQLFDSAWLDGECTRLAAEGLRTLVLAERTLAGDEYREFEVSDVAEYYIYSKLIEDL